MTREPLAQLSTYPGQDREQHGKLTAPNPTFPSSQSSTLTCYQDPDDRSFMAIPYFCRNGVFEPAEPVEPLPILVLNSYCAPEANPNAELQYYADVVDSSDSSEEGNSPLENDDQDMTAGQGKWVAGGAPVLGRKKTPKPFSKGEVIDLTTEDDADEAEAESKVYRRTYTLDDEAVHLIDRLPSPKSREAMIRHDVMSEVNPNLVKKIIKEERWDRLSIPPSQDPYVPVVSPFTPVDRPKYPLSAMHPRGSLTGMNWSAPSYYLSDYYSNFAKGDPWSEKAMAQMYAAAHENVVLPGHLGKRRREEPVGDEQHVGAQPHQWNRDSDAEGPPLKKPMHESHWNAGTVGLKGKAKMAISNLVHGYISKPAGLFIKPRSKIPRTPIKASASASGKIKHGRAGGAETSRRPPPKPPRTNSPESLKMAASILPHTPPPQTTQYSQHLQRNTPPLPPTSSKMATSSLPQTVRPRLSQSSRQIPQNAPLNPPEIYNVAAPFSPKTPSPQKSKQSPYPRITGRIHKPSQSLRKAKLQNAMKVKTTESEASKRRSASLQQQLQHSAADSWAQSLTLEPDLPATGDEAVHHKAKKVRTKKIKSSIITENVLRSGRISKKVPASVKV